MKRTPKQKRDMLALSDENEKLSNFIYKGVKHLRVGTDLRTNIVTIKNLTTNEYEKINYYELKKLIND